MNAGAADAMHALLDGMGEARASGTLQPSLAMSSRGSAPVGGEVVDSGVALTPLGDLLGKMNLAVSGADAEINHAENIINKLVTSTVALPDRVETSVSELTDGIEDLKDHIRQMQRVTLGGIGPIAILSQSSHNIHNTAFTCPPYSRITIPHNS